MRIFTCNQCSRIHLEIGNTQIHFETIEKLKTYLEYLTSIDTAYYAAVNRKKGLSKVIIIPLSTCASVHLGFTAEEFETLKTMISNYLKDHLKQKESFVRYGKMQALSLN